MGWIPFQEYSNFNIWLSLVLFLLIVIAVLLFLILLKLHLNHVELVGVLRSYLEKLKEEGNKE